MLEVWLEHAYDGLVALAADACHLASRVSPNDDVAELQIGRVLPMGHLDRRGRIALVVNKFESGGRQAAGPHGPHTANVQLAEVLHRGGGLPAAFFVRLPADHRLAAAEDRHLAGLGPIDHVVAIDARVFRRKDQRAVDPIGAAAEHDYDVAVHRPVDGADRLPDLFEGGKRLGIRAGVGVVTTGCDIQRSLHVGPCGRGQEEEYHRCKQEIACRHDAILSESEGSSWRLGTTYRQEGWLMESQFDSDAVHSQSPGGCYLRAFRAFRHQHGLNISGVPTAANKRTWQTVKRCRIA